MLLILFTFCCLNAVRNLDIIINFLVVKQMCKWNNQCGINQTIPCKSCGTPLCKTCKRSSINGNPPKGSMCPHCNKNFMWSQSHMNLTSTSYNFDIPFILTIFLESRIWEWSYSYFISNQFIKVDKDLVMLIELSLSMEIVLNISF